MSLPNYTLTVSQPGYLPTTSYDLEDTCLYDAVDAFQDELYQTAHAHDLPYFDIPSWEDIREQLQTYREISVLYGGYVHEMIQTSN